MKIPAAMSLLQPTTLFSTAYFSRARRALSAGSAKAAAISLGTFAAIAVAGWITASAAMADLGPPPSGDRGSDPTVGTLPSHGSSDFDALDQTITLRGTAADLRAAVVSASGDGAIESIDLGDGQLWLRYYGDVALELNLAVLADVEVAIFSGFQGGGLSYSVGQAIGFGEARRIAAGGSIRLDPLRFQVAGLLDDTLFVAGLHQSGARTLTSLDFQPVDGIVVIRQDI